MSPRRFVVLAAAWLALLCPLPAYAWQEAHQIGDEASVRVDVSGHASVEHAVKWRIVRGPLVSFDLRGVGSGLVVDPDVSVVSEDRRTLAARAAAVDGTTVRVTLDEPRAAMHGAFTFRIRWQMDLVSAGLLARDGAVYKLSWPMPPSADGYDSGSVAVDLPRGQAPPWLVGGDSGTAEDGSVSTVDRRDGRDVLTITRPHVARGESVTWPIGISADALTGLSGGHPASPPVTDVPPAQDGPRAVLLWAALCAFGVVYAALVHGRGRSFARACSASPARVSLVPIPLVLRVALCGSTAALGLYLQSRGMADAAGGILALTVVLAALRAPRADAPRSSPGRWVALAAAEAFRRTPRTRRATVATVGPSRMWLHRFIGPVWYGLAIGLIGLAVGDRGAITWVGDACLMLPLWLTGRAFQLPESETGRARGWLARLFGALGKRASLRVVPWCRLGAEGAVDEVRVLALPRAFIPGLTAIEVGLGWMATPLGSVASPEVLVRTREGSAADARLTQCALGVRTVAGRSTEERVVSLLPRTPTRAATLALVVELAAALTDRRALGDAPPTHDKTKWRHGATERRVRPQQEPETTDWVEPAKAPVPNGAQTVA